MTYTNRSRNWQTSLLNLSKYVATAAAVVSVAAIQSVNAGPVEDLGLTVEKSRFLRDLRARSITNDTSSIAGSSYDYVIVGGGLGGLVTASRLSEDSSVTVLVIEAGNNGDAVRDQIDIPAMAYYNGVAVPGSVNDWNIYTDPEPQLNNRSIYWPRGKVLGGCTAVNGLYLTRGTELEHNLWSDLIGGNGAWNWKNILPYLKRFEHFSPPSQEIENDLNIMYQSNVHGLQGPINSSVAQFVYPQIKSWEPTWSNLGFAKVEPFAGNHVGGFITLNSIDPSTNKRSYSKSAYLDPAVTRPNLVVLTDFMATKINFDNVGNSDGSKPKATGATLQSSKANSTIQPFNVTASKELVLAAGVVGTVKILQLSGIGPTDLLDSLKIPVVKALPGVGAHVTDHLAISIGFNSTAVLGGQLQWNKTFQDQQLALYKDGKWTESLYSAPNNAVGWVNITTLFGSDADSFISEAQKNVSLINAETYPNSSAEVLAGINASYVSDVTKIFPVNAGVTEILLGNTGQSLQLQLSHQKPFSKGLIRIKSTNPFETPMVKANYLGHPADIQIMVKGIEFMRKLASTAPLSDYIQAEIFPGSNVTEAIDLEKFIRDQAQSQYHPAGGAAMLPENYGGVVDPNLKVYGVDNLRIIDASVIGVALSLHHMEPLYALAEKGSDLIRGYNRAQDSPDRTSSESAALPMRSTSTMLIVLVTIFGLLT